jgi:hypothetical protein
MATFYSLRGLVRAPLTFFKEYRLFIFSLFFRRSSEFLSCFGRFGGFGRKDLCEEREEEDLTNLNYEVAPRTA